MTDVRELYRLWLNNPHHDKNEHHSHLLGFEESLRYPRTTQDQQVRFIGNIHLPFPVETAIKEYTLRWGEGAAIVYVDLKAGVDDYATAYCNRTFTDVRGNDNVVQGAGSSSEQDRHRT